MATENINVKINVDNSQAQKNTDNLKQRIKELREQMALLAAAGKDNTEEYRRMAQEAGKLQDAIGDVSADIKNLANDNQTLAASLQGVGAGVAVFGALQGAAALLGVEDEKLLKTMQKIQAVQAILNSLNTIANALNKNSALMTALRTKSQSSLNKELAKTTTEETAGTAATTAFTAAEGAATTGAITLKGAVKAVGTAIKSIPVVGWILAAVAAITTLIALIKDANDEEERGVELATQRLKLLNKIKEVEYGRYLTAKDEEAHWEDVLNKLKTVNKGTQEYADLLSEVASYTGISAKYLETHPKVIEQAARAQMSAKSAAEAYANNISDINSGALELQKLMNEQGELLIKQSVGLESEEEERLDELKTLISLQSERQKQLVSESGKLKEQADAASKIAYQYKNIAKSSEDAAKAREKNTAATKAEEAAAKARLEQQIKLHNEAQLAMLQAEIDAAEAGSEARLEAERKYLREQERQEKEALKVSLANAPISAEDRNALIAKVNDKWRKKEADLDKQYARNTKDEDTRIAENKLKEEIAMREEYTREWYEKKIELDRLQEDKEKEELERKFSDNLISYDEYLSQYDLLTAEHAKTRAEIEEELNNKMKEGYKQMMQQRLGYAETFINAYSDVINAAMEAELEAVGDNEQQQKEVRKKYAKAKWLSDIAGIGVSTAKSIMEAWESVSAIQFPFNMILGGVLTAMIGSAGALQTAQATSAMSKALSYGKGGMVNGRSHNEGGVDINAEGGEAIINKRSTAAFLPLLSAINEAGGGVPINSPAAKSSNAQVSATVDDATLTKIVKTVVAGTSAIPVVVTERDITDSQSERRTIVSRGRI